MVSCGDLLPVGASPVSCGDLLPGTVSLADAASSILMPASSVIADFNICLMASKRSRSFGSSFAILSRTVLIPLYPALISAAFGLPAGIAGEGLPAPPGGGMAPRLSYRLGGAGVGGMDYCLSLDAAGCPVFALGL